MPSYRMCHGFRHWNRVGYTVELGYNEQVRLYLKFSLTLGYVTISERRETTIDLWTKNEGKLFMNHYFGPMQAGAKIRTNPAPSRLKIVKWKLKMLWKKVSFNV